MGGGYHARAHHPDATVRCAEQAGTLESTIRHELLHMLIESYAQPGTPLWFREGLVLYFTEPKTAAQANEQHSPDVAESGEGAARSGERRAVAARLRRSACEGGATGTASTAKQKLLDWVQNGIARLTVMRGSFRAPDVR